MKRLIIADESGRIIGTAPHPGEAKIGGEGPVGFRIVPLKGQKIHEVELPKAMHTVADLRELHKKYIVKAESQLYPIRADIPGS